MIRRLDVRDISLMLSSEFEFKDAWNSEMLSSGFNGGRLRALGAFDGDILLGYICYSLGVDDADVETVVTKPFARRKGVAASLYERAEKDIILEGKEKIFLEVREGNTPARTLYSKMGFKDISIRKKYYADGENAVVMCKEIKNS